MEYLFSGLKEAFRIIFSLEGEFLNIVFVSVKVSFTATLLATILGVPFGIFIAEAKFFGRQFVITILNTLMSFPTVVAGLMVYSFLSRRGAFGELGLLYTLGAMVIGQFVLSFPIVSGLTFSSMQGLDKRVSRTILSLGAGGIQSFRMFLHEARFGIIAAIIAGFGRVFAEVGVSMMLGGNIKNYTRNITTAIALETSKGEFALGIALGLVLLFVAFIINVILSYIQKRVK